MVSMMDKIAPHLAKGEEQLQHLLNLQPEQMILRWINAHVKAEKEIADMGPSLQVYKENYSIETD